MLHVERQGAGAPLLLIHGLGGDHTVWEPVLAAVAAEWEVLAVDLPGFGRSPVLPDGVTPTPAALAAAVAVRLDDLGLDRVAVAGNSLGGWVALELARLGRAAGVTAIAPAGFWGRPLAPRRRHIRDLPSPLRHALPWLAGLPGARRLALAGVVAHPERVPVHAARRIVASYLAAPGFSAANDAMRADYLRVPDIAGFGTPVTLAWAARDRLVGPPRGGVPGVRSVVIPDAGHLAMWDRPGDVAALILETGAPPA